MIQLLEKIIKLLKIASQKAHVPKDIGDKLIKAYSLMLEVHAFYKKNEEHPTVVDNDPPEQKG